MTGKWIALRDVAALAQVSTGTASRALSRPDMVHPETRARVQAAADRLGYVTNGAARALVNRRSYTVGALIPRFGSATFATMLQSLEATLAAGGYKLLLSMPEYSRVDDPAHIRTLLEAGIDAIVLLGARHSPQVLPLLLGQSIPMVAMWAAIAGPPLPSVFIDEAEVSSLVVQHLAQLGHRNIGFISGHTGSDERAQQRLIGLRSALVRHGIRLADAALLETSYGFSEGFVAAQQLLQQAPNISAIVCGNDYLATGVLAALQQAGIRVPEEMSVTGINDNDFAAYLLPPLTTVHIPLRAIGEEAGRFLLSRLRGDPVASPARLPVRLVVRHSTARCPARC